MKTTEYIENKAVFIEDSILMVGGNEGIENTFRLGDTVKSHYIAYKTENYIDNTYPGTILKRRVRYLKDISGMVVGFRHIAVKWYNSFVSDEGWMCDKIHGRAWILLVCTSPTRKPIEVFPVDCEHYKAKA